MVLMDGFSWDLSLLEKAEDSDFFILVLSWELEAERPPEACTELFIILTIIFINRKPTIQAECWQGINICSYCLRRDGCWEEGEWLPDGRGELIDINISIIFLSLQEVRAVHEMSVDRHSHE